MSSIDIEGTDQFLQIDKISDDVYTIAPNLILRFTVALSKIVSGKRYHYHTEFLYQNKNMPTPLIKIKRSFDYYLSFENHKADDKSGNKTFVRIGPTEYLLLKRAMDEVVSWFTDKKYANLYAKQNGKLIMTSPVPSHILHGLPQDKCIKFAPTIISRSMAEADKGPGVIIDFGDFVSTITLEKFMGLQYTISIFNMYQAAITLLNYASRPPVGTNTISFIEPNGRTLPPENVACGAEGIIGRQVQSKYLIQNIESLEG